MTASRSTSLVVLVVSLVATACGSSGAGAPRTASTTTTTRSDATTTTTTSAADPITGAGPGVNVYAHTQAGDLSPAVAGVPDRVYVPNTLSNTVDVIDPSTLTVIDHFAVGDDAPARGAVLRPLDVVRERQQGQHPHPDRPMHGQARARRSRWTDPYNLYFTQDGTRAVVMAERNSRVEFRDPKTFALVKSVPVAHRGVNHADFTPNGKIMIASCEFSGYLVRIDVPSMTVTGELDVGGMPVDVRSSPDGTKMYVANQGRGGVSIVDPVQMAEVGFIPTGRGAHGLYPSRDGTKLYVTNRLAGSISVIDFATDRVVDTWRIGGSPDMGGVSADGTRLWLSGRYDSAVYVIDTTTGKLVATIKVGNGPHGLAVFPQPGRYSLGHTGNYR